LTAAKILGETAGVDTFKSKDAFARHNGTAPLPVWSSNRARHRLSRTMDGRKASGDGGLEALRFLERRLSDVVYAALRQELAAERGPIPT